MKKLYIGFCNYVNCNIFINENKELITSVHDNDGDWRDEYFNPVLEAYGIEIINIDADKLLKKYKKKLESHKIEIFEIDFTTLNYE